MKLENVKFSCPKLRPKIKDEVDQPMKEKKVMRFSTPEIKTENIEPLLKKLEILATTNPKLIPKIKDKLDQSMKMKKSCVFENFDDLLHRKTLKSHKNRICGFSSFEEEGVNYLVSGSFDKSIKIWDFDKPGDENITLSTSSSVRSITKFEMNGKKLLASAGSCCNEIEIWDLSNKKLEFKLNGHSDWISSLKCFEKNGNNYLFSGSNDESIKIWDMSTKVCVHTLYGYDATVTSLDIYQINGKTFLVSGNPAR